jgi:hypothetical protein|nr:MAG TPA_asm: hypothetical protein [Caudoviricetes sp.]
MEQNKILTHVYIVEVESKEQDKDNSNDVCDIPQTKRRKTYKMRWVYEQKNRCLWRYGWQRLIWSLT